MKPKDIQKLIDMVEKSNISELEVSRWGRKVIIRKNSNTNLSKSSQTENIYPMQQQTEFTPQQPSPIPAIEVQKPENKNSKAIEITSPMVGTYYRSPSPESSPYVEIGTTVAQGQTLCIIEAMKLMNEIEAEYPCKIVEILVEDSQPVEYNQPLFRVEKI